MYAEKLDYIGVKSTLDHEAERKESVHIIQNKTNWILGRQLDKGASIKRISFSNCSSLNQSINFESLNINVASNTLTLFWK